MKSQQELDGRNSTLCKDFHKHATDEFNDMNWLPHSIACPKLHEDFAETKVLPLKFLCIDNCCILNVVRD